MGKDLDGMVLYFDDPTRINAKLDLPYYFGTKEHDAKDELLKIIIKICQEHLIDNKNGKSPIGSIFVTSGKDM